MAEEKAASTKTAGGREHVRLYTRGTILGHKRGKSNQHPSTSLVKIEGVQTKEEVEFYLGKKLAYVYRVERCCARPVPEELAAQVLRCHSTSDALSQQNLIPGVSENIMYN
ncbi:60S ribosomal protein L35A [Klebsormidium nitens]|uniref:60S ribosomal protein L35A n=1 Tax=Klebsormidium nitens TaxID=105231 RepID=A0A1Y1HZ34_KLENI|nr:60S ribosomal protein L35A [Klebsormidium nitens]|eukprot:GAQ83453.1 60S ribosomal protein L35A [Klebsormidium nitens]